MRTATAAWICAAATLGVGAAACAQTVTPVVHELRLVDGVVPVEQRLISARQGDSLRLRLRSDTAGELHLHAYRLSAALQPGQAAELAFTAHATGRFRFEWHGAKAPGAGPRDGHHQAPLALLEVRPR